MQPYFLSLVCITGLKTMPTSLYLHALSLIPDDGLHCCVSAMKSFNHRTHTYPGPLQLHGFHPVSYHWPAQLHSAIASSSICGPVWSWVPTLSLTVIHLSWETTVPEVYSDSQGSCRYQCTWCFPFFAACHGSYHYVCVSSQILTLPSDQ